MAQLQVTVKKLNRRKSPVTDFADKRNVVDVLQENHVFESVGEITNALGKWHLDRDGFYTWEKGAWQTATESGRLLTSFPWYIADFGIDEIWKKTKGEMVNVFVLDSGFRDLQDIKRDKFSTLSVLNSDQFGIDNVGHGTLMASIIAGNDKYVYGIAPDANIISIKITETLEADCSDSFYKALLLLKQSVSENSLSIVNCSFTLPLTNSDEYNQKIQTLIDSITSNSKAIFVAAVGNHSDRINKYYPANYDNVISCSGITKESSFLRLASSNYWEGISISTPGAYNIGNLKTVFPDIFNEGTSHACAFMSGLLALKLSHSKKNNKTLNILEIKQFIKDVSVSLETPEAPPRTYQILDKAKLLLHI